MNPNDAPGSPNVASALDANPPERTRSGVFLGTFRNIRFYLDYSWFVIVAMVIYLLSVSTFPLLLPGQSSALYFGMGVVAAALFFFSIVLHELGHSIVSQRCGIPVPSITLLFIGGIAELSREPDDPKSEFKIAIAGPAVSLALVLLFGLTAWGMSLLSFPAASLVFAWLAQINLILVLFNAVPGYPLDGGRVLRALLWMRNGKLRQATYVTAQIGIAFSFFLIIAGIFFIFAFGAWNGLVFILIGVFLKNAAESGYSHTVYKEVLEGVDVGQVMTREPMTIPARLPLNLAVDDYFLTNHHVAYPVTDDDGAYCGLLRLEFLKKIPREKWPYTEAADLVREAPGSMLHINSTATATQALRLLMTAGQGRLAVLNPTGQLVGMITRHDLLHFIRIHTELQPA
ncbi:MAG TPA: site-2 protease family protein [Chthoniobacteraceae bacterium]|nr:site-2 protease family protein [Chthoniobacteraceae bacterium]